jgi:23S rRNA (guanosine2251-2'-O)-methyltransferase
LVEVDDLANLAMTLKQRGHRIIAATETAQASPMQADFRSATTIVIGNEGGGIRPELLAVCDEQIAIPQVGHVGSLNAAVSAGILFYEARRQRAQE